MLSNPQKAHSPTKGRTTSDAAANQAQRQSIAYKYGDEFLALIDGNSDTTVTVTDIVQKLAIEDEERNIISETDGALVGKVIQARFKLLH